MKRERVYDDEVKHSFLLFLVKAKTEQESFLRKVGELKWFSFGELDKEKVIPSDKWLLQNKFDSKLDHSSIKMDEKEGELSNFRFE